MIAFPDPTAPDLPPEDTSDEGASPGSASPDGSAPDGTTPDPEETERLGDEIARLAAHLHAATYRLLVLIRTFDEREGWGCGFRSCAQWLSWRTGIAPGPAREKVRVARALGSLPLISSAMARGELSFSKVRALSRVATPENESDLLAVARHATASHIERLVRAWRRVDRLEDAEAEAERHRNRHLRLYPDEDGSWVIKGRLDPEVGAVLEQALEWAADALYRQEAAAGAASGPGGKAGTGSAAETESPVTCEQRWADALGLVAEQAMARRERDDGSASEEEEEEPQPPANTKRARPILGRADRFQVVVHMEEKHPEQALGRIKESGREVEEVPSVTGGDGENVPAGTSGRPVPREQHADETSGRSVSREQRASETPSHSVSAEDPGPTFAPDPPFTPDPSFAPVVGHVLDAARARGLLVPHQTARRLACDASVVRMSHDAQGNILDVGRQRRTAPPAIRRALEYRDGGCRFPGCGCRHTDAHHIVHWADGGETKLDGLVLLCRRHHRAVHEEGFRVEIVEGGEISSRGGTDVRTRRQTVRFFRPDGSLIPDVPEPPSLAADPVQDLVRTHGELDIHPGPWTATPLWQGEVLDLGLAIDMLRRPGPERRP